uniref:Uncharacterized protein n=1 Tax=Anguilla anguilla TaxID=7936 RepID=A0A0E9UDG9_ANGAN
MRISSLLNFEPFSSPISP